MRPVSDAFKAAVVKDHRYAVLVEVLTEGVVTGTLTTVQAGSVTLDATAQARGRLDLEIIDDGTLGLVPNVPADTLAPYGRELRVSRGVRYPSGVTEYVTLGVFRIDETRVSDTAGGLRIQITGQDRSARIREARFEGPSEIAQAQNVATAILGVIQAAYPEVQHELATTTHLTGHMLIEEGADRWALAQDMATNIGLALYFNGDGKLVLVPQSTGAAVVTLAEGEDGVLLEAGRSWTRIGAYNRVIATGENTGEVLPVRGVATDDNPLSPTYYFGPFGRVPRFFQSQFLVTSAQCRDAAAAMLARGLGTTQSVIFGSLVLPHLEPGDVARVTRARPGIDEDHVCDSLTMPLTPGDAMSGTTRATQVV